jgi:signal transduction histidine kinase
VLQNLIGNSIKYCDHDTAPAIQVAVKELDDAWVVSVKDNGIGMKQEYCEQIFLPFKRLHGRSGYPGSGMGLAICRKLIESAGGKIWATSKIGEGSSFHFTIPRIPFAEEIEKEQAA